MLDANHGQSAALMAGFQSARGEWIATLDADGQNDPADLPCLLAAARLHGLDMVNGYRADRHDSWIRRCSSRIANAARIWLTGRSVRDVGCSTRVFRRDIAIKLPFFHGMHRFLPTLMALQGACMGEQAVNHRPRRAGRSKYGIGNRLWTGIVGCFGVRWLQRRHRSWNFEESAATPTERAAELPVAAG